MTAAFAEREASERGLEDVVEIHSAGTDPADEIHDTVVEAMAEVDTLTARDDRDTGYDFALIVFIPSLYRCVGC